VKVAGETIRKSARDQSKFVISLTPSTVLRDAEELAGELVIETDVPGHESIAIPWTLLGAHPFELAPKQFFFGVVEQGGTE